MNIPPISKPMNFSMASAISQPGKAIGNQPSFLSSDVRTTSSAPSGKAPLRPLPDPNKAFQAVSGNADGSSGLQFFVAEGSTREDPIIRIKGQDDRGEPFESTFHLNQVDPTNANYPEMMALVSYREFFGNVPFSNDISYIAGLYSFDHQPQKMLDKIDYTKAFDEYSGNLMKSGFHDLNREFMDLIGRLKLFTVQNQSSRIEELLDLTEES